MLCSCFGLSDEWREERERERKGIVLNGEGLARADTESRTNHGPILSRFRLRGSPAFGQSWPLVQWHRIVVRMAMMARIRRRTFFRSKEKNKATIRSAVASQRGEMNPHTKKRVVCVVQSRQEGFTQCRNHTCRCEVTG